MDLAHAKGQRKRQQVHNQRLVRSRQCRLPADLDDASGLRNPAASDSRCALVNVRVRHYLNALLLLERRDLRRLLRQIAGVGIQAGLDRLHNPSRRLHKQLYLPSSDKLSKLLPDRLVLQPRKQRHLRIG